MSNSVTTTSSDATLRRIVERIVEAMHPQRIFLFGSRAAGRATETSDYDLCVIADADGRTRERSADLQRLFPERDFSMDVFVLSPEEFDEQKDIANTLGYIVARDGEVLYEHQYVRAWVRTAERDRRVRESLIAVSNMVDIIDGIGSVLEHHV